MKKQAVCLLLCLSLACVSGCAGGGGQKEKKAGSSQEAGQADAKKDKDEQAAKESSAGVKTKKVKLYTGEIFSLGADRKEAAYQSADKAVATVSKDGTVQGIRGGKTTVSIKEGNEVTKVKVVVKKRGMVYPSYTILKGECLDLQFSNATVVTNWKSDNKKVASVTKKGQVKAKKLGKATIRGTDGKHTYECHLTVKKKPEHVIYLTFDDGPNRYTTPRVLKILKKNKVKATFFELKPAKNDFDLTERVIKEGHSLAMHGYQHKYNIIYRSVKIYHENLDKLRDLFFKKTGIWCVNTRFPGGSSNTVSHYNPGVMTRITKKIHSWGYHYHDWHISSGDSDGIKTSDGLYRNVIKYLSKSHDNVILMHDYVNNDVMLGALDRVIKYGKKNGYIFLPITPSTAEVHHRVNN